MAVFVRRPILNAGILAYGALEGKDFEAGSEVEAVRIGREVRYPGIKVVAGLWRPDVYSPDHAEVAQIQFHRPSNHYTILLDTLETRQYLLTGIHVPYVREGDRVLPGDAVGGTRGFFPRVSLQESASRYWDFGKVRAPRSLASRDCWWDVRHDGRVRKFLAAVEKATESYS